MHRSTFEDSGPAERSALHRWAAMLTLVGACLGLAARSGGAGGGGAGGGGSTDAPATAPPLTPGLLETRVDVPIQGKNNEVAVTLARLTSSAGGSLNSRSGVLPTVDATRQFLTVRGRVGRGRRRLADDPQRQCRRGAAVHHRPVQRGGSRCAGRTRQPDRRRLRAETAEQLLPLYGSVGRLLSLSLPTYRHTWTVRADSAAAFQPGSALLGRVHVNTGKSSFDVPFVIGIP